MPKAASDVMQSIIFAAVVDAMEAMKAASKGVPNNMLRDLQSLHRNSAFADLPKAVQDRSGLSVRAAFNELLEGRLCRRAEVRRSSRGRWTGCRSGSAADQTTGEGRRTAASSARNPAGAVLKRPRRGPGKGPKPRRNAEEVSTSWERPRAPSSTSGSMSCRRSSIGARTWRWTGRSQSGSARCARTVLKSKAKGWRDTPERCWRRSSFSTSSAATSSAGRHGRSRVTSWRWSCRSLRWSGAGSRRHPRRWQSFFLMPLMHSEKMTDQDRCMAEFQRLGGNNLKFALLHHDQIKRFGRFPGRNKALGRVQPPEEREAIAKGETF